MPQGALLTAYPTVRKCAALVGLVALAGCAVGPNFKAPAAPHTDGYTAETLPPQTAASEGSGGAAQRFLYGEDIPARWWTLFHSAQLDALVEEALQANPDVGAAQAALRKAHEELLAQRGSYYPSFDGTAGATRQKITGAEFGQPQGGSFIYNLFNASVNVSYTLDLWGGVRRSVEAAGAQADYQSYQLQATYLTLAANVVTTAIQEASLRAQLEATQQIIVADRQQLATVQRQLALGGVSRLDLLTQQAQLASELAGIETLRKELQQNDDLLAVLIGKLPSESTTEAMSLDELTLPAELPLSVPSQLVARRPDVRASEALLHEASAQIGVATADMLPQLSITGQFGGLTTEASDLLKSSSNVWSIGGSLTQPLFHGGTLLHRKRAAEAAYEEAAAQYRSTVLGAFRNVADALHAVNTDAVRLDQLNIAAAAASESLDVGRARYAAGSIGPLDLLVLQRAYWQARIAQLQAQATRYADTAALFQALGGSWWSASAVPPQAYAQPQKGSAAR
jgi:NodT family efflux transporter outer membrane factor (OMF) lipoprotein